ncbi:hypothetical protein LZ554_009250 [Drepanopeziza brunnea f. sp. 'monogermtubi']|nr:hypothetical protein LZ554_009250 [Drepanopeziza brunnea f. sp. 'monogermtubi']
MPPKSAKRLKGQVQPEAASSRSSSTRRSARFNPAATPSTSSKSDHFPLTGNHESSDFPSHRNLGEYVKNKRAGNERDSISTFSTSNDLNEGSDYSTQGTSVAVTPAPVASTSIERRGRTRSTMAFESAPTVDPLARAAALRNSQYSLIPTAQKRKRIADSYDDEDENADVDDSPDAQLARALQAQEDDAANSMAVDLDDDESAVSDSDKDDDELATRALPPRLAKRPKVMLAPKGSNSVKFATSSAAKGKGKAKVIQDSDETDGFVETEDSDEFDDDSEDDIPLSTVSRRRAALVNSKSKTKAFPSLAGKSYKKSRPSGLKKQDTKASTANRTISDSEDADSDTSDLDSPLSSDLDSDASDDDSDSLPAAASRNPASRTPAIIRTDGQTPRSVRERGRLEFHHPEILTMWDDLENSPKIGDHPIEQPTTINRELKPFQLQGVGWMIAMEKTAWGGGLLGDEMGMGKTIQAVSLIMSDWPAKQPSLVLIPPVAIMQWQQEIADYTDGTLKTFVYHGTNAAVKDVTYEKLMKYDVILMSYNSLESMYRKQVKGFKRKHSIFKEDSVIHRINFHRVILDEAHSIKSRTSGSAKACFALKADHKWCLSGTPLQNRIGEFFSLIRFLGIKPFACYLCKKCPCSTLNWDMDEWNRCRGCTHGAMQHVSVFNQELLNPIQKFGNAGPGVEAFRKLGILTGRFMLRRVKRDHSSAMELPAKEIYVDRQFFGEEENDFAGSIMNNNNRKFETYVAQGVLLNNYANIFGLIMQMRQVADHPDLILKRNGEGGQNILVCCICDETAEEAIRSACKHDFCRECAKSYLASSDTPDCPQCHIALAIDLEQPDIEQDEQQVKKSSIINRIKMENWTSSSKIETLVHDLHELRSKNMSHKSIIFSQFTTMLQLVEWRLRRAGITTVMLDGSMTPAQRQASINHFMTDVKVECFLVSLKAGGVALNLTEASRVFIVDPWWNPAAEWQSADRCHRIGQGRPCKITRLCIEDSVESRMVLLQEKKASMINSTINSDQKAMESLTPEDMQFLFRGS